MWSHSHLICLAIERICQIELIELKPACEPDSARLICSHVLIAARIAGSADLALCEQQILSRLIHNAAFILDHCPGPERLHGGNEAKPGFVETGVHSVAAGPGRASVSCLALLAANSRDGTSPR